MCQCMRHKNGSVRVVLQSGGSGLSSVVGAVALFLGAKTRKFSHLRPICDERTFTKRVGDRAQTHYRPFGLSEQAPIHPAPKKQSGILYRCHAHISKRDVDFWDHHLDSLIAHLEAQSDADSKMQVHKLKALQKGWKTNEDLCQDSTYS
jgi:hypothetical protein